MTTYKDLRQHYLGVKKGADDKERIAKAAKDDASKCHAALLNYSRKQLRACEKAGLLTLKENAPNKNHYHIKGTNLTVCVNSGDDGICIFDYNRINYFACPLDEVGFSKDVDGNLIWSSLTDEEKDGINAVTEFIV
jgi:hypothetical protein